MSPSRIIVALVVVLLPGLMLTPVWQLCGLGAGEDDILYYFPARTFLHDTILAGEWPWLNPWVGLGRPFVADPQTAFWYPPTWLFVALPPLWAYPLSLWLHYSLALWGMYRLLRDLELGGPAALLGGIAFAFCGFMLAHRAHFTMQHAAAWTPWVIWRLHRYTLSGTAAGALQAARGARRLAAAVAVIALQCLAGHVQIAALTALGALIFLLSRRAPRRAARVGSGVVSARWFLAYICAAGVFAIQWMPTFDYVRLCTRVERTYRDFVENSWHPTSAVGFVMPMLLGQRTPNFFGQPYWGASHQVEQFGYTGLLPLFLALLALRKGWRSDPRRRPWVILGGFAVLLALGQYGPICPFLYLVPGSSLFRCPARALLLVNLAVAALAAVTFHELQTAPSRRIARLRATIMRWTQRPLLLAVLLVAGPLILIVATMPLMGSELRAAALSAVRPWNPAVWVPLVMAVASLAGLGLAVRRWQQPALLGLLTALTAVDLGIMGWTIDVPAGVTNTEQLIRPRQPADWMELVRQTPHRLWVVTARHGWTPGEYIDPVEKAVANTNVLQHIATLTDYGPLQPRSIEQQFRFAPWGEAQDAKRLLADSQWMRLYDVGWILLCDDEWPAPEGCEPETTTAAGWRLYRNPAAAGWAAFDTPAQVGAARFERKSPAAFTTWADTWPTTAQLNGREASQSPPETWPRLVVSQLALPGWTARVDGRPVGFDTAAGALLSIRVPPGEARQVEWSYFPPGLIMGGIISLLSIAALVVTPFLSTRRR
jgi:hypothetical protein